MFIWRGDNDSCRELYVGNKLIGTCYIIQFTSHYAFARMERAGLPYEKKYEYFHHGTRAEVFERILQDCNKYGILWRKKK